VILDVEVAKTFAPLLKPARYKGAYGGRGSAKSHFFAGHLVMRSVAQKIDAVCIRENQISLDQSVKKLIEAKIAAFDVLSYFKIQEREIKSIHGGIIIFTGMQNHTADSIMSLESYDIAWFEQAEKASQKSLDLLRPTIRKDGSELWFSWNPNLSTDPVDVLLRGEDPPPGTVIVRSNWHDNPWFPDVLKVEKDYDLKRDPDKYAHIWQGEYQRNSEARVFRNWTVEDCVARSGTVFRFGADWGFATDPSVLIRCWLDGNRLYVDHEAWMIGCEIVNLPALFQSIPEAEKWPIVADSARPETISHMRKNGFPKIFAAIKGPKSLEEGVEFLKSFDIIVHPRCQHLIDELTMYSYKKDQLTARIIPLLEDKDNHVIDALRYACEGARRANYKPVQPKKVLQPAVWSG
jgi:phage terminase large subunit